MHATTNRPAGVLLAWLVLALPAAAAPAYSIKIVPDQAPPKQLGEPIRKLLDNRCLQLNDAGGNALIEVWLRKQVPVKATAEQVKNGLTYREVPSSTIMGAMRVVKPITDYKKQKVPAGVYTL